MKDKNGEKMRIIELFAGIGACSTALKKIGIDLEIVDAVEIDKFAIASFNAIHNTNFEKQDITEWNKQLKDVDLITHGSPCQDFSVAGKQAGGDLGSGTRSSLMYETIRIVGQVRPKYVLWENVKNILSAKHKHNFDAYIETMDILGYNSYYQVLNAKNFGIPQNRERVFTVSVRKDLGIEYEFPEGFELKKKLKDVLEEVVDEKYYLSDEQVLKIKNSTFAQEKLRIQEKDYCDTILARDWKDPKCVQVGELDIKGHDCVKRVYSSEGISPTLTDMQGGNRQPKVMLDEPVIAASRGRNLDNPGDRTPGIPTEQRLEINKQGLSNTITTVQKDNYVLEPTARTKENDLLLTIFNLCSIIDTKEKDKYERSRTLLQVLWKEIRKKEIWQEIRGFYGLPKEKILQSKLYENGIFKDRKLPSTVSTSTSDSSKYNEESEYRKKVFNMWEDWKDRYTSQGWELSEQQYKQLNLFMQELSSKTTPTEIGMCDMWRTDERFRILQQTLFEIQEIWRPVEDEISSRLRIRKLSPRECWRLMGFTDEDFDKARGVGVSDTQLYKQARKLHLRTCFTKNF